MKTHVLTVSRNFPSTHKRKGEPTYFVEKLLAEKIPLGMISIDERERLEPFDMDVFHKTINGKLHTIRANYEYWKKRIDEVQRGEAILSVRYWSGKPYNSKQVTVCNLTKDDGVGINRLEFMHDRDMMYALTMPIIARSSYGDIKTIAKNDGLSWEDFNEWVPQVRPFKANGNYSLHLI